MGEQVTRAEALFLLLVLVGLVLGGLLLARTVGAHEPAPDAVEMLAVAPGGEVQLAALDADLQQLYHAVAADGGAIAEVRCYCGCEAMLEHRSLLDCFVRPDGGWERHAVGCGVCRAEAEQVLAARAAGTPMAEIIADIDATYGLITAGVDA